MGTLFYVMAIMGCSDGTTTCAEARVETTRYISLMQCQAAMAGALQRNSDIDYPVVTATCRSNGQLLAQKGDAPRRG